MYAASNVPAALAGFIDDVERSFSAQSDTESGVRGVQARLHSLLRDPSWLAAEYREADPVRYRTHLLAVAPSRRFSVLSLVWLPGQVTAIHDHITWCVVGVLQGIEREQRYGLRQGPQSGRWLLPQETTELGRGSCSSLVPPEENIHQVRNAGETLAISIRPPYPAGRWDRRSHSVAPEPRRPGDRAGAAPQ
jgi:3-mercaptopropionate dioxygenase